MKNLMHIVALITVVCGSSLLAPIKENPMLGFDPEANVNKDFVADVKQLKQEWPQVKDAFDRLANAKKAGGQKLPGLGNEQAWPEYHYKLMNFLAQLSYTNYYTKSVEDNLKKAVDALSLSFEDLKLSTPAQLKDKIKVLNGLSSKYNLGKLGRVGDEYYIKDFKALLADNVIPDIAAAYKKAAA